MGLKIRGRFAKLNTTLKSPSTAPGGGSATPYIVLGATDNLYVYDLEGTLQSQITQTGVGGVVAAKGGKIYAGAQTDATNGSASGALHIFNADGTGQTTIYPSDAAANYRFGCGVAVTDTKIFVGAKGAKSFYIYDLDGSNEIKVTPALARTDTEFATQMSAAGNKVVVGEFFAQPAGTGAIYVYNDDGTGGIRRQKDGVDQYNGWDEWFGSSVAINDNGVVTGAIRDDLGTGTQYIGKVYLFDNDSTLSNQRTVTNSDYNTLSYGDRFGASVAMTNAKLVVGAPDEESGSWFVNNGAVYVYDYSTSGFTNEIKITASVSTSSFGKNVGIYNNKIYVHANGGNLWVYNMDGSNEQQLLTSVGSTVAFSIG